MEYTIESAVKAFGKETVENWLNQFIKNRAYRKQYTQDRNAAVKIVKQDPRYKEILAAARKKVG